MMARGRYTVGTGCKVSGALIWGSASDSARGPVKPRAGSDSTWWGCGDAEVKTKQQRFQRTDQSETSSLSFPCLWSGVARRWPAPGRGRSAARPPDWPRAPSVVGLSSSGWVGVGLQRWSERVCREAVCLKPPREDTAFTRSWFCVLPPVRSTMTRSRGTQHRFTWTSVSSERSSNSLSDFFSFHFIGCGVGLLVLVLVLVLLDCGFCQLESTSQVVWAGAPVGTSPPVFTCCNWIFHHFQEQQQQ